MTIRSPIHDPTSPTASQNQPRPRRYRRYLLALTAIAALGAASVAPAEFHDSLGTTSTGVRASSLDAASDLVDTNTNWVFAFDVHTAGDDARFVDAGRDLGSFVNTTPSASGTSNGLASFTTTSPGLSLTAGQWLWAADVFAVDAGSDLAASITTGPTVGGANLGFLQNPGIVVDNGNGLLDLLVADGRHLGSFSGELDLMEGQEMLVIVIGFTPADGTDNGNDDDGINGVDPALVPTPAAIGPGLALLGTLLLRRRRQHRQA